MRGRGAHATICVLFAIAAGGCASAGQREVARDETTVVVNYADARHGIRLTYDPSWKEQNFLKPRGTLLVLVCDDDSSGLPPTVSLVARPDSNDAAAPDLREMEQRLIERAQKQIGNFTLVETSDTTVADQPARRVIYTGARLGMKMKVMNVLTIHNNRGYAVAYMADPNAFDDRRADVDGIISSITWMK